MCQLTCVSCQACNFFLFEPISSPSLPHPYPVVLTRLLHTMRRGRRYYYLLEGVVTGHLGLLIFRPRRTQGCSGCGQRVLTVRAQVWLAQGLFLFHHLFVWIAWMTGVCVFHPIISIVYCYPAPLVTLLSHPGLLLLPSTPIYSGHQIPSSSWPQSSLMLLCLPGFPASLFFLFHPASDLLSASQPQDSSQDCQVPASTLQVSLSFSPTITIHHCSLILIAGLAYVVVLGL